MRSSDKLKIYKHHIVQTSTPGETITKLCEWINQQPETFSSMGVAAFGPLCLDTKSKDYGSVTSTPKLEW